MGLYKDEAEAALHQRAMESLAREEDLSNDQVVPVYEAELAFLKETARVDDFLPAIVHRRARARLRNQSSR